MLEVKYNGIKLGYNTYKSILEQPWNHYFYLIKDGKRISQDSIPSDGIIHVVPKLLGGKGGFGSMLRAIGAQIEKTTNREACRDLSGRRLRDINEEKRLKAWIDKQATREQEAEDKKQKKLERLVQTPKFEFKDATYDKERSELPERLEDAVAQGMEAVASSSSTISTSNKRKQEESYEVKKKKIKGTLWLDEDIDVSSGDESDDNSVAEDLQEEKIKTTN